MKKFLVFLFFIINLTGFARFIEACKVTSVTPEIPFMVCRSKQTGKEFGFYISNNISIYSFKKGRTYKIWFYETAKEKGTTEGIACKCMDVPEKFRAVKRRISNSS